MTRDSTPFEVIAHRCRGYGHKENSILAIRAALHSPVQGIEIDLRLTKDLKWVAIHDPFYQDEQKMVKRVHERTLVQLKREVISLDTILALFSAYGTGKELYLDVKDLGEHRQLVRLAKRHGVNPIIIAWEPKILENIHKADPTLRLGLSYVPLPHSMRSARLQVHKPLTRAGVMLSFNSLENFDTKFGIGHTHVHLLSEIPSLPIYSVQVPALLCSKRFVKDAHARNIKVIAFTVSARVTSAIMKRQGVDAILADTPKVMRAV